MSEHIFQLNIDANDVVVGYSQSNIEQSGLTVVTPEVFFEAITKIGLAKYADGALSDYVPPPGPVEIPDNPTLSDWRVGLLLWNRLDDLLVKVQNEKAKGTVIGKIAEERVNYANNVLRSQLVQLKDVFNFTDADIDESLWRASQVAKGDLSGIWPLST